MDKSQLRKLTQEFANGELDEDEFGRVRAKLIDDITEGRVTIVREPAPKPVLRPEQLSAPIRTSHSTSIKPIYVVVGLLVLGALIWMVYPSKPDRPYAPATTATAEPPPEIKAPGPGERLLGEFLRSNSWAPDELTQFAIAWNELTNIEREETRASGDLELLFQAILREFNAQQALAALDDTGGAHQASIRIHQLGSALGMADRLPSVNPENNPASAESIDIETTTTQEVRENDDSAKVEVATVVEPVPETPAPPLGVVASEIGAETPVHDDPEPTPTSWLENEDVRGFTIQLFALSTLDNVQAALADYDDVDLHVVTLPNEVTPHRILYGVYATPGGAETAYSKLPASLTQGRTKPVIKSIQTLRAAVAGVRPETIDQLDKSRQWLDAQRREQFTLQLFAMNADDSVEKVLAKYPNLRLEIHYSNYPLSRFRILYGAYETPEEALRAFQSLPRTLTASSGNPVVKSFAELQDTSLAASP